MLQRSPKLSPLEYADPKIDYADQKKAPVSPLESADPNSPHAKSCRINTSKKYGGEGVLRSFVSFLYLLYFLSFLLLCHASLAQQPVKTLQPRPANSAEARPLDADLADAKSRLEKGQAKEAEPILRAYLAKDPTSADAHFLLGLTLFKEIQEIAVAPTLGRDAAKPPTRSADFREQRAKASLAEFSAGAKYRAPSARDLKIVALDYVLLGDYPDADKWLTKMLEWTPNDSEGWYYLGRTKYNENRFEEAVRAFEQSLKLEPKNVKTEDNLGLAYAGLNRVDAAISAYRTAMEWQKDASTKNPGPFIDLADLLLDQNRAQESIAYLREAIQIAPQDSKAHELLGKAYSRLDQFPQAQAELEKAEQLAPENANLPCMLGPVYRKQGLTEKAKVELDRCASLNGTHSLPQKPRP
jgi:tetratricopeptide (TPR) repeat protein